MKVCFELIRRGLRVNFGFIQIEFDLDVRFENNWKLASDMFELALIS